MKFTEITDKQWNMIESHLPRAARTGRSRAADRMITNGIIYVLTTGCRWQDMPKRYGDDSTANLRLRKWQQNKTWSRILSGAIKSAHKSGKLQLQKISVDSSSIPAKKGETA